MPVEITEKNFEEMVLKNEKPVMVDFWASWCGPCRMLSTVVDRLADEFDDQLVVGKINVDEQPSLAERYHVLSIPTLFFFKNGELVNKLVGARDHDELSTLIKGMVG